MLLHGLGLKYLQISKDYLVEYTFVDFLNNCFNKFHENIDVLFIIQVLKQLASNVF